MTARSGAERVRRWRCAAILLVLPLAGATAMPTTLAQAELSGPLPLVAPRSTPKGDRLAMAREFLYGDQRDGWASRLREIDGLFRLFSLGAGSAEPNEPLRFGGVTVRREIVEAIVRASVVTGIDPVYLMAVADKESSFQPEVRAGTSSAEGLYQFITKTWLEMVKFYGPRYGLKAEAAAIQLTDDQPLVTDDETRQKILGLRRDPYLSAVMAAELSKRDRSILAVVAGRPITPAEAYLAHFFGIEQASRFISMVNEAPSQAAPRQFPAAARANRAIFYKTVERVATRRKGKKRVQVKVRERKPLNVAEVYEHIDRMIDRRVNRYAAVMDTVGPISSFAAAENVSPYRADLRGLPKHFWKSFAAFIN